MDATPGELDRITPPPEQEQLRDLIKLADNLTSGGAVRANLWRERDFPNVNLGVFLRMFVSRLTSQGEASHPDFPLLVVRAFKTGGKSETNYQISRQGERLRIDKHEYTRTEEDEQEAREWRKKYSMENFTPDKALEAANEIKERYERSQQNREFEKEIGYSYVDAREAQVLFDNLTKLQQTRTPLIKKLGRFLKH